MTGRSRGGSPSSATSPASSTHAHAPSAAAAGQVDQADLADQANQANQANQDASAHPFTKSDYERLADLRYALRRYARHTELASRRVGVSPQQYVLLLAIKGFPERDWANITELAERLQVRHNAVIGLVNRAERSGLVVRSHDASRTDRRVVQVRLTELGEGLLQIMADALRAERSRVRQAFESITGIDAAASNPASGDSHAAPTSPRGPSDQSDQ